LSARDRVFELPGLELAALEWGEARGIRALALHGWLDNANSFDLLAPLLEAFHILALDCAGHGASGFRSPDADYNLWQDVRDVLEVANQAGWETFSLIGHSRGAAIATLVAGAFPHRVARLVLHEGGIPMLDRDGNAAAGLARAIEDSWALANRSGRVFPTRKEAIAERASGFTKTTVAAAEILARRSLRRVEGGYQWHADQRLKGRSPMRMTQGQIESFIDRTTAPVLAFFAEESPFANTPWFRSLMARFRDVRAVELPGGHHCHLEGGEVRIAEEVRRFFGLSG
jgi:pimeloyl-ACP methyl ester carboxylesterase